MIREKLKRALVLMLALICATAATAAMAEAMTEGADSDWYMDVLADEAVIAEYSYHAFVDVNGDGVPVLIISTTQDKFIGIEDKGLVFLCSDGAAKQALEVGGSGGDVFYCNPDERALARYSRISGEEHISVYHVNGDALELAIQADRYDAHHAPDVDNDEVVCLLDGEVVDEAAYTAVSELYALDNAVFYGPMD